MKNNFFITEKQKNLIVANAEETLPIELRTKYAELFNKYGKSFSRSKKENLQLLWQYAIDHQDALALDDPWRVKLVFHNQWQYRKTDSTHILAYIEHAGMLADFYYLQNSETYALEIFVSLTLQEYGIHISMRDLLECQDFDKYFSEFLIGNCDSKSLEATKKTKETFDKLLKGLNTEERTALVNLLHVYAYSDMEFSTLHKFMKPIA